LRTGLAEVALAQAHEIHAALQGQHTHCIELDAETALQMLMDMAPAG